MTAHFLLNEVDKCDVSERHHAYVKYWPRADFHGSQKTTFQWMSDPVPHFNDHIWIHFCILRNMQVVFY